MDRTNQPVSDQEFLGELREAVDRYFRAVDAWEAAYYKYYRLPDPTRKITPDLAEQEREFTASRKRLEELAPRARRLGFAHGVKDPWTALLRTTLGQYAPQERTGSAVSRSERAQVNECMILLAAACEGHPPDDPENERPSWLQRILDFFY
jgi:hypothetical protein